MAKLYLSNYRNLYGSAYGMDLWQYDFGDASLEDYVKDVTLQEHVALFEKVRSTAPYILDDRRDAEFFESFQHGGTSLYTILIYIFYPILSQHCFFCNRQEKVFTPARARCIMPS